MNVVYLGIGSNIGKRKQNLEQATIKIAELCYTIRKSRFYETLPRYREDQPRFLNAALQCSCTLKPNQLLAELQRIEAEMGRERKNAGWMGPRNIDIDILLFGAQVIHTLDLAVPHPRIPERKFVLIPLLELNPLLSDPQTGDSYCCALAKLESQGIYYHTLNRYIRPDAHGSPGQSR